MIFMPYILLKVVILSVKMCNIKSCLILKSDSLVIFFIACHKLLGFFLICNAWSLMLFVFFSFVFPGYSY